MIEALVLTIKAAMLSGLGKAALGSVIITAVFTVLDDKHLFYWGWNIGAVISKIGSTRVGKSAWERIETKSINAFGALFEGIRDGANADDEGLIKPEKPAWRKKARK